jgi:hypothetical protein
MGDLLCAIHQPNFFPRLSTLAKLFTADIWVILDDVQFARRDYQHRCRLPAVADAGLPERWLTVPVRLPAGRATLIKDVEMADPFLAARSVTTILRQYYRRSPYRAALGGALADAEDAFARTDRLADLTRAAGGSAYLCGTGGSRYLDPSPFTAHGLTVEMFTPPQYQLRAGGSRVTALTDLAITGPEILARQLSEHARTWNRSRPGPACTLP